MDLQTLLARLDAIDSRLEALLSQDALTEAEQTEHDSLVAERAEVVRKVEACQTTSARAAQRQAFAASAAAGLGRRTTPDVPAIHTETRTEPQPWQRASVSPNNFVRSHQALAQRGMTPERSANERAYRFGMFGRAVLALSMPGRYGSRAALQFAEREFPEVMGTAHETADGAGTGYLIPEEFSSDFIVLRETYGVARRLFRTVPMGREVLKIPRWESGMTGYWVGEGDAITESSTAHDMITLTARKLAAIGRWSSEVDMNAVMNFGDYLAKEIAYAFSIKEDDAAFNGDGTSTYGHIQGVRHLLQNISGSTDSAGLVSGAGNLWSELTLANFHSVVGKLPAYAYLGMGPAWVCSTAFYATVMQRLELASGGVPAREVREGNRAGRPTFLGFPVEFSPSFPTTEADTTVCCVLGDFERGAVLGVRSGVSVLFSEHAYVNSTSVFEKDQIAIRATEHLDVNVYGCGSTTAAGPIVGLQTIT